jgi:hypothetical protein
VRKSGDTAPRSVWVLLLTPTSIIYWYICQLQLGRHPVAVKRGCISFFHHGRRYYPWNHQFAMSLNTTYSDELLANTKLSKSEEHPLSATRICLIAVGCLHVGRLIMTRRKGATWRDSTCYTSTSKGMTTENLLHIWVTSGANLGPSRPTWLTFFALFLNTSLQVLGYYFKINHECTHPYFFCSSPTKRHFTPGVYESRRLVTRATKFCTMRPNILGVILALLAFTYNNAYHFSCTDQNTACNSTVFTVAPKLWLLGMGIAACHTSDAKNLEVATSFFF